MNELIAAFPQHLRDAYRIGESLTWTVDSANPPKQVLVTGLGGSGIGGAMLKELVADRCNVPIACNNSYHVPGYVNADTLVIACSYSGNTEETLSAFAAAKAAGAQRAAISSGGQLVDIANAEQLPLVIIPGGNPPRSMLGYSLVQLLFVLNRFGLIDDAFKSQLKASIELLESSQNDLMDEGKSLAEFLHNRIPVVYSENRFAPVATRFRQQLNENAKVLCMTHALPEMNHNELVGWAGGTSDLAVVMLRNSTDFKRTQARMDLSKDIINNQTPHFREIWSKGESMLERYMYHIHLGDWATWYLAQLRQVDAVEVNVIDGLKSALSKI